MDQIIRYILEQTSGVAIALVLIFKIESKLDALVTSLNAIPEKISEKIEKVVEK